MAATLYGHAVDSEIPLPRAREGASPRGRLTVVRADEPPAIDGEEAVRIDERFTVHRRDGALVVFCERSGTYEVEPVQGRVRTAPGPGGPDEWEHRLACVVVPLLLAERGDLALHASAVATERGAVVFCGASGSGKSTTAWALGSRGFAVLGEDGCVATVGDDGVPLVWPGLSGVRLRMPSGERPVEDTGRPATDHVPLAAVFILGPRGGQAPQAERIAPVNALTALMPHTVHAQGASQAAAFHGAAAVARSVPVLHATLPDDLHRAGEHAEALLGLA